MVIKSSKILLNTGKFAIVDDEDYDWLSQWKWHENKYAIRTQHYSDGSSKPVFMHLEILTPPDGFQIDHINMNKLDNRKCNLRVATNSENMRNRDKFNGCYTSKYKGVSWHAQNKVWICNSREYLGLFRNEIAAANCYNNYAVTHYGEFAVLNDCPVLENWESYRIKQYSTYRGVSFNKNVNNWIAYIVDDRGQRRTLGYFKNEIDAANCYNHYAKLYHGDNAFINDCEVSNWEKEKKEPTSNFYGVCWNKTHKRWIAYIKDPNRKGKQKHIGTFKNELDAAMAYNKVAVEFYGRDYELINILE